MKTFPPRLWVTRRVIANENRLLLPREVFTEPHRCIEDLATMFPFFRDTIVWAPPPDL